LDATNFMVTPSTPINNEISPSMFELPSVQLTQRLPNLTLTQNLLQSFAKTPLTPDPSVIAREISAFMASREIPNAPQPSLNTASLPLDPNKCTVGQVIKVNEKEQFIDITPYLALSQSEAAKMLGIPSSTLSKRWKEASNNRKWPYRTVSKLDKEISTLIRNVQQADSRGVPTTTTQEALNCLIRKRHELLQRVYIRLA